MENLFKYNVGMYGGCFDPLHIGHLSIIYQAAAECKEFYIVLSYSLNRDNILYKIRYQWLHNAINHLPNVKILLLEDNFETKEDYNKEANWYEGSVKVKELIGKKIDVVYCGSDYNWSGNPYSKFYYDSEIKFIDRNIIPVSSTEIRNNIFKYWDYLPTFVRPAFVKRILICGMESTGKSTLTETLAKMFCTKHVSEYGRDVCAQCGSEDAMTTSDFEEIIFKHKVKIIDAVKDANKLLFIDTDAITTYFYASFNKHLHDKTISVDYHILKRIVDNYDLILFNDIDVPFVDDGLRIEDRGASRKDLSDWFKSLYTGADYKNDLNYDKFVILDGTYSDRLNTAKQEIERLLDK